MLESIQSESPEKEKPKKGSFKRLMDKVILAMVPAMATEVETPTEEQSAWVDAALAQSFGKFLESNVGIDGWEYKIEHADLDTRPESEKKPDDTYFINITGAWGRGPEVEPEIRALAVAMGEGGLQLDAVSLPGHGSSENGLNGWNVKGDFDFAADFVAAYIQKIKDNEPNRKIVINCYSMGGITALKIAAKYPHLIDGLILIDTPVFPQSFKKLALRFLTNEVAKLRTVRTEKPMELKAELPGLGIFIKKRIQERNKGGIPFDVLLNSARSLAKQDLLADGTINTLAEGITEKRERGKDIPVLILRGSNDYLVSHKQTSRLYEELKTRKVNVKMETIKAAGHMLMVEQPVRTGELMRDWLDKNNLA